MLASPVPAYAHALAAPAAVDDFADYAAREAQAADLESWTGGFHGVVISVLFLFLVVWLIVELTAEAEIRVEHHHDHDRASVGTPGLRAARGGERPSPAAPGPFDSAQGKPPRLRSGPASGGKSSILGKSSS